MHTFDAKHAPAQDLHHPGAVVLIQGDKSSVKSINVTAHIVLFVGSYGAVDRQSTLTYECDDFYCLTEGQVINAKRANCKGNFHEGSEGLEEKLVSLGLELISIQTPGETFFTLALLSEGVGSL